MTEINENNVKVLAKNIEDKLFKQNGPILTGDILFKSLGYASADAFRQAVSRGTNPIDVFSIEQRRGKFALTEDVAQWVAIQKVTYRKKEVTDE